MNVNRREREEEVGKLLSQLDTTAIHMAQLEWICGKLAHPHHQQPYYNNASNPGQQLFYRVVNAPHPSHLLYPALVECLEACLAALGRRFIAHHPAEQLPLMRLVLGGGLALTHCLLPHFTPQCLEPGALLALYTELSGAVRTNGASDAVLGLLRYTCEDLKFLPTYNLPL